MREYDCPYDENVLVRVVGPEDGIPYAYARQLLLNNSGGAYAVPGSKNPGMILLDADIPHPKCGEINAIIAKQLARLYMPALTDMGSAQMAYRITSQHEDNEATEFLRNHLIQDFRYDPEE